MGQAYAWITSFPRRRESRVWWSTKKMDPRLRGDDESEAERYFSSRAICAAR